MNRNRVGQWRGGANVGTVYMIENSDLSRVGCCWASNRLLPYDLLLCIRHSGDCFYDYLLIESTHYYGEKRDRLEAMVARPICSYTLGTAIYDLDELQTAKIRAGKEIKLKKSNMINTKSETK